MKSSVDSLTMVGHLRALRAAYVVQWKQLLSGLASLGIFVIFVPYMIIMGWIAGKSDNSAVLAYVPVGAILATMWNLGSFRVGHSLLGEFFNQTLDPMILSRSPMMVVMFGKVLSITTIAAISAPVSLLTVYAVSGELPTIVHPSLLAAALLVTVVVLVVTSCFFAPAYVLSGGAQGYMNTIGPFGIVFSGFLYPVGVLPLTLEAVARAFPTSWAMQAVVGSINGAPVVDVLVNGSVALGLGAVWLLTTVWMFHKVEERIRITGMLGRV